MDDVIVNIDSNTQRWLVMPKTAMLNSIIPAIDNYFGCPDSGTETICEKLEHENQIAISIISSIPKMGMRNGNAVIKGRPVDNEEMEAFLNELPGVPTYKPLKSDNELIAEGWELNNANSI